MAVFMGTSKSTQLKSNGRAFQPPAKNGMGTAFVLYVVFGSTLLIGCILAQIAMIRTIDQSTIVAVSKPVFRGDPRDSTIYLLGTWTLNSVAAIITVPTVFAGLYRIAKMNLDGKIFKEEAPIVGFMLNHGLLHLGILTLAGIAAHSTYISYFDIDGFLFAQFIFAFFVVVGAVSFAKDTLDMVKVYAIHPPTNSGFAEGKGKVEIV